MAENACCPFLEVLDCADTVEHKHLCCGVEHKIGHYLPDNDNAKRFCLGKFEDCGHYPKENQ